HCWSKVLPPDKFSFPSGHTMTTFSIALVVSYFYPSLEGALFFLALSIAVSRIVLRSEEHTSELQSRFDLVCRLLLEKKICIDNWLRSGGQAPNRLPSDRRCHRRA